MRRLPDAPRSFLVDASGRRLQTYAAHAEPSYVVVDGSGTDPLLRHRRLRSQPLRTNRQTQAPASTQSTRCTHQGPRRPFYFICDRWMQKTRLARVAAAQKLQSLYHKSCGIARDCHSAGIARGAHRAENAPYAPCAPPARKKPLCEPPHDVDRGRPTARPPRRRRGANPHAPRSDQ